MKESQTLIEVLLSPVEIVGDGLIASADNVQGRGVPVLILDTEGRQDLEDLFLMHRDLGRYGEASHQWLTGHGPSILRRRRKPRPPVVLRLNYSDPVKTQLDIVFKIPEHAILVEMILRAECLYLQRGKAGDVVFLSSPERIFVEVLSTGFEATWKGLHVDILDAHYKSVRVRGRAKRRKMASETIAKIAELSDVRVAPNS